MLKITWTERRGGKHPGLIGTAAEYPNLIFRKNDKGEVYYEPISESQLDADIAASEQRSFKSNAERQVKRELRMNQTAEARYLQAARERCAEIERELSRPVGLGGFEIPSAI